MAATNKPIQTLPAEVKQALEGAVARLGSQSAVAVDLGISAAVVNHLLKDRYPGDVRRMEERIRGQYMAEVVICPVMGTLSRRHCLDYQARPIAFTNPGRARLHAACKTCKHRNAH